MAANFEEGNSGLLSEFKRNFAKSLEFPKQNELSYKKKIKTISDIKIQASD